MSLSGCRRVALAVGAGAVLLAHAAPAAADPETMARLFLRRLAAGEVDAAKRMLESPKYRGSPPGGDEAFFTYASGHEPTLAFLVGRPFEVGPLGVREQRSDWYLLDGILYAYVSVPLRFPAERDRPYLLPGPMAFGRAMTFSRFMDFVTAPTDPAGFTLRLRPGLEPGLLPPPPPSPQAPPPPAPPGARPTAPVPLLGGELLGRPRPRDPGPVLLPSGRALATEQVQALLPRLVSLTLELALVRRGRLLAGWEVMRFGVDDAVVVTGRGETRVRLFKR